MALTDKDILITPNDGSASANPKIEFTGADANGNDTITVDTQYDGSITTLSYEGSAGQLFSISNDLSGTIFSVNDNSGIPSIEVDNDGEIRLAEFSGNVGIGVSAPGEKLHVKGTKIRLDGTQFELRDSSGNFKAALKDDGSQTTLFADGGGSYPYLTFNGSDVIIGDGTSGQAKALQLFVGSADVATDNTGLTFTMDGTYSDGRYEHRFRKRDEGGGIPLYIDKTDSTANSHTALVRFGGYTNNTEPFEVYGNAKVDELIVTDFVKATGNNLKFSAGGTHVLNIDVNGKIYPNTHNAYDIGFNSSTAFRNAYFSGTGNFANINTGQGATEVHLMNQNVRTSDSPTFQDLTVQGNLSITGDINSYNVTDLDVTDKTITVGSGQTEANSGGSGLIVDGSGASLLWDEADNYWAINKKLAFDSTPTTTNQGLGIIWTGFDKEGTTDPSDSASIYHTTNTGGHGGSVLLISSMNDSGDGIAFSTHGSSYLKHNSSEIITAGNYSTFITSVSNADTVDSLHAASFLRSDANDTATGALTFSNSANHFNGHIYYDAYDANGNHYPHYLSGSSNNGAQVNLRVQQSGGTGYDVLYIPNGSNNITWRGNTFWNAGNDGSGSGLDADLLDGINGASYLRSDADDTLTGNLQIDSHVINMNLNNINDNAIDLTSVRSSTWPFEFTTYSVGNDNSSGFWVGSNGYPDMRLRRENSTVRALISSWETSYVSNGFNINGNTAWHAGNDGPGSGLDADTLDGYHKSDINPAHSHYRWTNISASSAQARRFVIMRLYGCPAHWDSNWQDIHLKVWSESYEATNLKYQLTGDYGGAGTQANMFQLRLKDAGGSSEHNRFRLVLGTPVDAGWDHAGQDTYYVDVYAEASHYMNFTVAADFYSAGFNVNTLPTSGGATSVVYSSPTVSNITTFNEAKEHSYFANHKIWNDGNDGSASGLDADLLDGQHGSYYYAASNPNGYTSNVGDITGVTAGNGLTGGGSSGTPTLNVGSGSGISVAADTVGVDSSVIRTTGAQSMSGVKTHTSRLALSSGQMLSLGDTNHHLVKVTTGYSGATVDGPRLQGHQGGELATNIGSNQYSLRWDNSGNITVRNNVNVLNDIVVGTYSTTNSGNLYLTGYTANKQAVLKCTNGNLHMDGNAGNAMYLNYYTGSGIYFGTGAGGVGAVMGPDGDLWKGSSDNSGSKYWHAGNDGSGSGLDADTVDGKHKDFLMHYKGQVSGNWDTMFSQTDGHMGVYQVSNITNTDSNYPSGAYTYGGVMSWQLDDSTFKLYAPHTGQLHYQTGWNNDEYSGWRKIWDTGNDGSGSGLDADTVDGQHASAFLTAETLSSTNAVTVTGTKYWQPAGTATSPLGGGGGASLQAYTTGTTAAYMAFHRSGAYAINWGLDTSNTMVLGGWSSSTTAARMSIGTNGLMVTAGQGNLWGSSNDGSGSGLDADLLDGQHGSYYAQASHNHNGVYTPYDHFSHTGHGNYTSTTTSALLTEALGDNAFDSKLTAHKTSWSYAGNGDLTDAGRLTELAGTSWLWWTDNSADNVQGYITGLCIAPTTGGSAGKMFVYNNQSSGYSPGWREIWTSTSDGSGSGLDADLLDGQQGSYYAPASHNHSGVYLPISGKAADSELLDGIDSTRVIYGSGASGTTNANPTVTSSPYQKSGFYDVHGSSNNAPTNTYYSYINMRHTNTANNHGHQIAGSFYSQGDLYNRHINNNSYGSWSKIWNATNDGSGSGLDADLLDGQQGSYYAAASHGHSYLPLSGGTLTGNIAINTTSNPTITIKNTNTTINSGQAIGTIEFKGADDSGNILAGQIQQVATGTWGIGDYGSDMVFSVKRGGTGGSFLEKLRLDYYGANINGRLDINDYIYFGNGTTYKINPYEQSVYRAGTTTSQASRRGLNFYHSSGPQSTIWYSTGTGQGSIKIYSSSTNVGDMFKLDANTANLDIKGNITAYSTATTSDARLKENVRDLEGSLDKTLKLRGVKFDWIAENKANDQVGFIAQEVEEVLPEVVIDHIDIDDNDVKVVNYQAVVPVLVEAIKEQQAIINKLEARINALEKMGE